MTISTQSAACSLMAIVWVTIYGLFPAAAEVRTSIDADSYATLHEYDVTKDIIYYSGADADKKRHRLNLIIPKTEKPAPLLMWIPGGAWAVGNRDLEMPIAMRLAEAGIAVAVIDHRMSPGQWLRPSAPDTGAKHPDHINDAARAFAWLTENAFEYGYDGNNLMVGGYSSGAHLAALLVMDEQYLKAVGKSREDIHAAVPVAGAYDMVRYYDSQIEELGQKKGDAHVLGVFGSAEALAPASPSTYLADSIIPMLILSEADTVGYTKWFEEEVEAAELTSLIKFLHYTDETHQSLFNNLRYKKPNYPPRDAIIDFIHEHTAAE